MNGTRFMFDTNAIISLLKGNPSIDNVLLNTEFIATSVINVIEFLSFPDLNSTDKALFYELMSRITIISVPNNDQKLLEAVAEIRKTSKVKLPDAIIAATAISNKTILITNDKGFSKIPLLQTFSF
jgi:tRNA(fMet)-specific endonuclease VapC